MVFSVPRPMPDNARRRDLGWFADVAAQAGL